MKSFKCESNILTCIRHDMALYSVFYSEACFCLSQKILRGIVITLRPSSSASSFNLHFLIFNTAGPMEVNGTYRSIIIIV